MKKILIGVPVVLVGIVAAVPFLASLGDLSISYQDMYHWVVPKEKKAAIVRPETTAPPTSYDAQKCDETPDLDKFPETPLNGKVYQGDKAVDVVFKTGQARIKGDQVELRLFSSEARAMCKDTAADGTTPQDVTLVINMNKADIEGGKPFQYGWDRFGKQGLDYYYQTGGAAAPTASAPASSPASGPASAPAVLNPMKKQLIQGIIANVSLDAKAGGKAKGKAILCFAQPSPNAPPIAKPADYEEGDALPPAGLRHAIAGNFEIDFCP